MALHKNIRRFTYEGVIADDSYIASTRTNYENTMVQEMKDCGYTPIIDLGTDWSTLYFPSEDVYEFKLTGYGIYVGRVKACRTYGIVQGRLILNDTLQTKPQQ